MLNLNCSKSETTKEKTGEWRGRIENEDGVKVVANPIEPVFGEIQYQLQEDLSIGKETDDNYMFYRAVDIAVDQDESIYVLEYKNCRIQKFDKNGNYIRTIGRQGQGPGEFERPSVLFYDESTGNICVRDSREIVIFDKNGDYLNGVSFVNYPHYYMFDADGNIWGKFSKIGEQDISYTISMANLQGELMKDVAEYPLESSSFSRGSTSIMLTHGYEYDLYFSDIDAQTFIYGHSKEYKLNVIKNDGEFLYILKKDEPQMPFTGEMKSKVKDRYERFSDSEKDAIKFPEKLPCFDSIFTDDTGRIYVKRMQSPLEEEGIIECDIFSRDGYYLYKTKFPKQPQVVKNGFYYVIEVDEESGLETVKRYKILNWEQIKSEI